MELIFIFQTLHNIGVKCEKYDKKMFSFQYKKLGKIQKKKDKNSEKKIKIVKKNIVLNVKLLKKKLPL